MCETADEDGKAELTLYFAGKHLHVTIENPQKKEAGNYQVLEAALDGKEVTEISGCKAIISKQSVDALEDGVMHEISVILD